MTTKQVIVVRTDLGMRKGKMVSQGAHSALAFLTRRLDPTPGVYDDGDAYYEAGIILSPVEVEWLQNSFTKICVGIDSESGLLRIHADALDVGLESHLIQDNGTTEFGGVPTYTCVAIGPDYSERIDQITGHLRLI
jgi:PTH2 family peptidyl-tRNA hydrolase